jgi:hypothetical protein
LEKSEQVKEPKPKSLLHKIMFPSTKQQAQASVVLFAVTLALVAGFASNLAFQAKGGLYGDGAQTSSAMPIEAVTAVVEAECQTNPDTKTTIYAGQENEAALELACSRVRAKAPAR